MSLDRRAARASEALRRAVAESELTLGMPRRRGSAVLAFASAFAGVLVIVGVLGVQARWFAGQSATTFPDTLVTTPTTVPSTTAPSTTLQTTTSTSGTPTTTAPSAATTTTLDTSPPALTIDSPRPDERFETKTVLFEGTVEPGASVTVGKYEADVVDGHWSIVLVLSPGSNVARITATDDAGNSVDATVRVFYDPPKEVDFTAFATWGSCSETPPYDVYYGTAKPGSKVEVFSEYGGGFTYADAEGNWELKVIFEKAPPDKVFTVKVKDVFGQKKYFEFVYSTK